MQAVLEKVKSVHSSRHSMSSSSHVMGDDSGRGLAHSSYTPAPIHEETTLDDKDMLEEYVIQSETIDNQTREDIAAVDVEKAVVPAAGDAASSDVEQKPTLESPERVQEPVKADDEQPSVTAVETSGAQAQELSGSQATVLTEVSRQFLFVDEDKATGDVQMRSAWSLEQMKREKSSVDAFLVETLHAMSVDKRQLEQDQKDSIKTAEQLDQAAEDLSSCAMNVASRSVIDDLPLSETAIRAAAAVTVNLLNRAIRDELRQLPITASRSICGPYQIQQATIIVVHVLNAAASRMVTEDVHLPWTEKALYAAIMVVEDFLSLAIIYFNVGGDAKYPWSAHVWTPSAIRATCRIVSSVTDEAARQASTDKERSVSQGHSTQQIPQLQIADAEDPDRDQLALEEEAVARSSARLETVGNQPSSLALEPSGLISVHIRNSYY